MKEFPSLYPLKFNPILKEKVWGGNKLANLLNKNATNKTGESWEISAVDNDISVVKNGVLKNKTLLELISNYKETLLGIRVYKKYGSQFPLLFKFIDAQEDLSVQLHPNDYLANKRHNSFGKTELWYIFQADTAANIVVGFNQKMDKVRYQEIMDANQLTSILNYEKVAAGDAFFIAPGKVHAIGAGVLLAEIQQTSDITYRIFDYNRPDIDGKLRELHTELALEAINYEDPKAKLEYVHVKNKAITLCKSEYFKVNKLSISTNYTLNVQALDSFVVYMCLEGEANLKADGHETPLVKGETVLIPACTASIEIETRDAVFLEVYIP